MKKDFIVRKENNVENVVSVILNTLFDYSEGFFINFKDKEIYKIYNNLQIEKFNYSKLIEYDDERNVDSLFLFLTKILSDEYVEKDDYLEFEGGNVTIVLNKRLLLEVQFFEKEDLFVLTDVSGEVKITLDFSEKDLFSLLSDTKIKEINDYNFKEKDILKENIKILTKENNFIKKENLSDEKFLNKSIEELKDKDLKLKNIIKTSELTRKEKQILIDELIQDNNELSENIIKYTDEISNLLSQKTFLQNMIIPFALVVSSITIIVISIDIVKYNSDSINEIISFLNKFIF